MISWLPDPSVTKGGNRQEVMPDKNIENLRAAIEALEGQRGTLGDAMLEAAAAPLRQRLAGLLRSAGLQRRQVTVLFADVIGPTSVANGLGAEETLGLLNSTLSHMAVLVEAHQGRVLRFTGDGVKAVFGMDVAREDDAERALRAGLAILDVGRQRADEAQRKHGLADFAVRVGVHTGDVALGAGVEADDTAMGAAVHIAARMEQSAPPGALRISHDTWSLVRGLFELDPQPPLQVKGIEAPLQTYLVRAALNRNVASVERGLQGLRTPMVGRDAEVRRLMDAVAQARATRHLQALTLLGDAGLGKTRLMRDWATQLTDSHGITVRSQPDGLLRPWGLLRSMLAVQFGVADTDSAELARRKVVEGLSPWFDERGERQAQLIGQLSGLDFGDSPHVRGLDPRELRDQALLAFRGYLQTLAARSGTPPLLVVEDLHWADDGSLDLLQDLMAHAAELPLALIMTARPALLERCPDWGTTQTTIRLLPLAADDADELARALLQRMESVPVKLTALLVNRAEGNPYYMEELVRRLIDEGVIVDGEPHWTVHADRLDTVRLPSTLVGLLQARLDALPAGERRAARYASIIGHVFWDDALKAMEPHAPLALPALQRTGFVREHGTSAFEGTSERQFDHHLLHQVTYDTLLKAERKLGHGAAAHWLKQRTQGRGAEFLAMTGEHAERAGETALAIDCFEQAGKEAQARFANAAASAWLRRALVLLADSEPARRFRLLLGLHLTAETVGDRSAQDALHEEMAAALQRHPDDASQAQLLYSLAMLADRWGDRVLSESNARQACELAERCGAAETAALAHGLLVWLHFVRYEHEAARAHIEPGMQWAGRIGAAGDRPSTEARLLTLSAMVSKRLSRHDEARETLLDVLARGQAMGSPRVQLGALDNLAVVDAMDGRLDDLVRWGERALVLAQSTGNLPNVVKAQWRLMRAASLRKDSAAELYWGERNLPLTRAVGDRFLEAGTLRRLGSLRHHQGDPAAALLLFQQAEALFRATGDSLQACETAAYAASCEMDLGRPDLALSTVNVLLLALEGELARVNAPDTIDLRLSCHEVLSALGDARAEALLERMHTDVQADVASLTEPAAREHLIHTRPGYRHIVAAFQRLRGAPTAAG
jgi:class 3 adenylate cyclase/tetratricopeptide (TPR) repeat protein